MAVYNKRFQAIIEDHYGTIRAFAEDNDITYPTAVKYMRTPEQMTIRFARKLAAKVARPTCEIIGEGEE